MRYWLLKIGIYSVFYFVATTYWKKFGWWFLVVCALVLLGIEILIDKRINSIHTKKILQKYPVLKEMSEGQTISIELKNGKKLIDVVYIDFLNSKILIGTDLLFNKEKQKMEVNRIRWIKMKQIKTIVEH